MTYEADLLDIISVTDKVMRMYRNYPLLLGGVAASGGGTGGPAGGFIGYLPQTRIAYDLSELADDSTPASGMSLLDNLNHIRYDIEQLDIIVSSITSVEEAPNDGKQYVRQNEDWEEIVTSTGFENRTDSDIVLSTRTVTVSGTFSIFSDGVKYDKTGDSSCETEIPDVAGLHYIYFDSDGVLQNSQDAWEITGTGVPVCTVFWNGSAGAVCDERHNYKRNQFWHEWAHDTIGCRYETGLSQTYPTTTNDGYTQIEAGIIHDEDIDFEIDQMKLVRLWYETSANVWTWINGTNNGGYDRPYIWNAGTSKVQFPKSDSSYTLTDGTNSNYIVVWVYATLDIDRPIYILTAAKTSAYANLAAARQAVQPSTAGLLTPEMKIIYRWIFRGDGEFQESVDYRMSSSLPAGGTPTTAAIAVTFSPTGNISSTNVQTAISELDTEKTEEAPIDGTIYGRQDGEWVEITVSGVTTSGTTDHSELDNLDYASAGHTGFLEDTTDIIKDTHIDWGTGADQVSTTDIPEGTNQYYTDERVDDRVATLIQNGVGITWDYDDDNGTLTPTVTTSGGGLEDAPSDGSIYGRQDASWVEVSSVSAGILVEDLTSQIDGEISDFTIPSGIESLALYYNGIRELESNYTISGTILSLPFTPEIDDTLLIDYSIAFGLETDAPSDGRIYGRQDGGWVSVLPFPDQPPASPNTEDDEFNSADLDEKWTKSSTAANDDIDTTWKSHVYANFTGDQSYSLQQDFAPAGAFSITACCNLTPQADYQGAGITAYDDDESEAVQAYFQYAGGVKLVMNTRDSTTWNYTRKSISLIHQDRIYLHLQRDSSNNWGVWVSFNGYSFWRASTTYSKTFTVHHFKIEIGNNGSTIPMRAGIDWIRRDWITL